LEIVAEVCHHVERMVRTPFPPGDEAPSAINAARRSIESR
jgi:hypothetical protein